MGSTHDGYSVYKQISVSNTSSSITYANTKRFLFMFRLTEAPAEPDEWGVVKFNDQPILLDDHTGDTVLHHKLRILSPIPDINLFIKQCGIDLIVEMVQIVNHDGDTPIDILVNQHGFYDEKNYNFMLVTLSNFMLAQNITPLYEKIDADKILMGIHYQDKLFQNLALSCWLINTARDYIQKSYTHPDCNFLSADAKIKIGKSVERIREVSLSDTRPMHFTKENQYDSDLSINADGVKKLRTGNCGEFAYFALYLLRQLRVKINGSIIGITNADHFFLVIDTDATSDFKNPSTWGKNAVICDSWAGEAYPAIEINTYLHGFKSLRVNHRLYNVLTRFNSHYHALDCEFFIPNCSRESYILPADKKMQESFSLFYHSKIAATQNNQDSYKPRLSY